MTTTPLRPARRAEASSPRDRDLARRFTDVMAEARTILGVDLPTAELSEPSFKEMMPALTAVAVETAEQIRSSGRRSKRARELCDLALRGADLHADLKEYSFRRRRRALAGVESALGRMRCMSTADELVESVCTEIVRSCGFSRAMLSRVSDTTWMPWVAHFAHREIRDSDREWMAHTKIPLKSMLLERELLETHQAAFTTDAHTDPRTSKEFVKEVGTSSYAAAPIVPAGRVVGFLHADHFPHTRVVDEIDCYVLGEFAAGFGRVYERVVLRERLNGQRDHVRETLRAAETIMDNLARAELELARHEDERSTVDAASALTMAGESSAVDELLTPREREVIGLIVSGQSNSAIAERLVISEGTVKSHVKQILRKLGAVNRSEAIARYLGMIDSN
jgi:DNA-binding CsgD family transcriptional regulator/GAF domain-containing protein